MNELDILCVCAERYAMGRRTYVVGEVCGIIKSHIKDLEDNTLYVIQEDIERSTNFGMDIDKAEWDKLLKAIQIERMERI